VDFDPDRFDFGVLGSLTVRIDGTGVPIRPGRQRALLVALLLRAGSSVPTETLIDLVWSDAPPATARNTMQVHVTRLRQSLGDGLISTDGQGYRIDVPVMAVDCARFDSLLDQARRAAAVGDLAAEFKHLSAALALWRGRAFADIDSTALQREYGEVLEERRLVALERRFEAGLALGRHSELVAELAAATAAYPLRERLWCQRLLALYRTGRQGEALTAYQQVRGQLVQELGVDPGPELRRVHEAILSGEPAIEPPVDTVRPGQMPPNVTSFTGRTEELAALDARLLGSDQAVAVSGPGGVGKTALALYWAYLRIDRFPDGQLYADLGGCAGERRSVPPEHVLDGFLRALGVTADRIPANLAERSALYRSLLRDREAIIVLDNARSAAQVRPLMPGSSPSRVLITSRERLDSLLTLEGARFLPLEVLDTGSALDLLRELLPANRPAAPDILASLASYCDQLPLALRIAAARVCADPYLTPSALADALAQESGRLEELSLPSGDISMQIALDVSYQALSQAQARTLRLIANHPGSTVYSACVAALIELPPAEAGRLLDELCRTNLLYPAGLACYGMHDLVRLYARGKVTADDTPAAVDAGLRRGLDWLLAGATEASQMLGRHRLARQPDLEFPPELPPTFRDIDQARTWLENEQDNVVAAVERCSKVGWHKMCWQLVAGVAFFLQSQGQWEKCIDLCDLGLESARAIHDTLGECMMLAFAGDCSRDRQDYETAIDLLTNALAIASRLNDTAMITRIEGALSAAYLLNGQTQQAERLIRYAIIVAREDDDHAIATHHQILLCHILCEKDPEQARLLLDELADCGAARSDPYAMLSIHALLADIATSSGNTTEAVDHAEFAIHTARSIGQTIGEADGLTVLGRCYQDVDNAKALFYWRLAFDIYHRHNHPKARQLHTQISAVSHPA
jgi:DNA-binding SARP family transcriptional activator